MSNRFQGTQQQGGNTGDMMRFFTQMMTMPASLFMYSINMLVQMMQAMPGAGGQGMNAMTGGMAQTFDNAAGCCGSSISNTGTQFTGGNAASNRRANQQATRMEDRNMSQQNWGSGGGQGSNWSSGGQGSSWGGQSSGGMGQGWDSGDQGWNRREECRDQDPCDVLRLVRYKILFLKRDLEIAFPEHEELVVEEMTPDGFVSWKVAEFIQQLARGEVEQPPKWREKDNYPANEQGGQVQNGRVIALPDKDKRYLRVYAQVLAQYARERKDYEKDQVEVLRQIRDRL
jgi:hypothetical protein